MIDLHTHVLAGIDDGPPDLEGSVAMARTAREDGIHTLVATPHVSWTYTGNTAERIRDRVTGLRRALDAERIDVTVRTGAEIALTRAGDLAADELGALGLGGGPWLLVECPLTPAVSGLEALLHQLQLRGHRIVLGHPERCPGLQRTPELVERLVAAGMVCSITAGSITGRFGRTVRGFAHELLRAGLVHNVTSDAHDAVHRAPELREDLEAGEEELPGLLSLAGWLTEEVPAALLAGEDVPPPPAGPPGGPARRRLGFLRRAARSR